MEEKQLPSLLPEERRDQVSGNLVNGASRRIAVEAPNRSWPVEHNLLECGALPCEEGNLRKSAVPRVAHAESRPFGDRQHHGERHIEEQPEQCHVKVRAQIKMRFSIPDAVDDTEVYRSSRDSGGGEAHSLPSCGIPG
eukprot:CAMPEP_0118967882 /NCGR_PEP_ID=MMETSP1173-20130426/5196_1 /TAXON_ID=1034831 /ORGANISM="Rhizochromulina marina cf, Strain CCMP1243" /LENGTH=137 /DNA_ID=CAMNT_0006916915 /DNA_START=757 /DNA_END=1170 /DNA_ORIENTATION=-